MYWFLWMQAPFCFVCCFGLIYFSYWSELTLAMWDRFVFGFPLFSRLNALCFETRLVLCVLPFVNLNVLNNFLVALRKFFAFLIFCLAGWLAGWAGWLG